MSGAKATHGGSTRSRWGEPPDDAGPNADPEAVARSIALARLSAAPRSRAELAQTMAKRGVPEDVTGRVLDRFCEVGLVDDAAFARAWVQSRQPGRGLARRALATELRRRGIDPETAADALEEVTDHDEIAAARRLVSRKLRSSAGLERSVRMRRLTAMLGRKGYSGGVAVQVVREALDQESAQAGGCHGDAAP
jgi:regulatory protein